MRKVLAFYTLHKNRKFVFNVMIASNLIILTACNTLEVRLQDHEVITFSNTDLATNNTAALSVKDELCNITPSPRNIASHSPSIATIPSVAAATARWGEQAVELVPILNTQAELYRQHGRFADAEPLYRRAIAILEKSGTSAQQDLATLYGNFGVSMRQAGQFAEAEQLLRQALALRSQAFPPGHQQRIPQEINLSTLLIATGHYTEAQKYLDNALQVLPKNDPLLIDILNNLAAIHRANGDYRQAELALDQALRLVRNNSQLPMAKRVSLLNGRADLYLAIGDTDGAAVLLQEVAKNLAELDGDTIAESLNNIAQLRQRQHLFPQARFCQEQSLAVINSHYGPNHPNTLLSKHNLGVLLYRMGDFNSAATLLQEVLTQRESTEPMSLATADTLDALAGVEESTNHIDAARQLLNRAFNIRTRWLPKQHPDLATSRANLAVLEASAGNYAASLNAFVAAFAIDSNLLEQVVGFASEEQKITALAEKNRHLYALFSLVTEQLATDPNAVRLAADSWLKRKGLILEVQQRYREALISRDGPKAAQLLQQLSASRKELAELVYVPDRNVSLDQQYQRLNRLKDNIHALDNTLVSISPSYEDERLLEQADVSTVAAHLPPHSVLIELVRFDRFLFTERDPRRRWGESEYLAFLISPQLPGGVKLVPLGAAPVIEKLLNQLLSNIGEDAEAVANVNLYAQQLYRRLFLPLEQQFPSEIKAIFLAPDGQLNLLPFEILRTDAGGFLTQKYLIAYLATGRDLLHHNRTQTNSNQAFLLGDPDFNLSADQKPQVLQQLGIITTTQPAPDRGVRLLRDGLAFAPLPWTRQEVESIRKIVNNQAIKLYLGKEAVEDLFDTLKRPRFIHIATHGFFLSDLVLPTSPTENRSGTLSYSVINNPLLRAGLAFAGANQGVNGTSVGHDGILTAEEVLDLDLRGTELVVLSACETGLGQLVNGEGVYGLRRAFAAAGARGLIISLWPVPDQETQELMIELYRGIEHGLQPQQALQQARNIMIEKVKLRYGNTSPFYWGGFIYQGIPTLPTPTL